MFARLQETRRFTATASHSNIYKRTARGRVSQPDCFPAPSPKGRRVGSRANTSGWHVQIHMHHIAMKQILQRLPAPPPCALPAWVCSWELDAR